MLIYSATSIHQHISSLWISYGARVNHRKKKETGSICSMRLWKLIFPFDFTHKIKTIFFDLMRVISVCVENVFNENKNKKKRLIFVRNSLWKGTLRKSTKFNSLKATFANGEQLMSDLRPLATNEQLNSVHKQQHLVRRE